MMSSVPTRLRLPAALAVALTLVACGARQKQHRAIKSAGENLRFELAELYVKKGAREAAIPLLQKILSDKPKDVRARLLYGKVLRDLRLYPQAERELLFARKLAPKAPAIHAALGVLYDLKRESSRALRHHIIAVRSAPSVAAYRNNLGFSLYLAGKFDAAIGHLEQALAMDPSMTVAYNNLAFAYGKRKQYQKAERTFRSALSEASTLVNMAIVYENNGDAKEAELARARAYALNPDLRPTDDEVDSSATAANH
jgi:tetratricopeptide (TPR) repeat protein